MKTISSCDSMRSTRENEKVFTDILRKRSKDQRHHTEIKGNTDLISETGHAGEKQAWLCEVIFVDDTSATTEPRKMYPRTSTKARVERLRQTRKGQA